MCCLLQWYSRLKTWRCVVLYFHDNCPTQQNSHDWVFIVFVLYLFVQEYIETCEKKGSKGPRIQGSKNSRKLSERTMWIIISNFHILFVLQILYFICTIILLLQLSGANIHYPLCLELLIEIEMLTKESLIMFFLSLQFWCEM